jgi:GNAT superfamily N-acetyltransferase
MILEDTKNFDSKLYSIVNNRVKINNAYIKLIENKYLVAQIEINGIIYVIAELRLIVERSNVEAYLGLNQLYVDIHFRKLGIASLLLDYAYWYAKVNRLGFLFLHRGSAIPNFVETNKIIDVLGINTDYLSDINLIEFYTRKGFLSNNNGNTFFKDIKY